VTGQPALLVWAGDTLLNVTGYSMVDDRISVIYLILNPEKLAFIHMCPFTDHSCCPIGSLSRAC